METINRELNERLERIEGWMEKVEQAVKDEKINVDPKTLEKLRQALGK